MKPQNDKKSGNLPWPAAIQQILGQSGKAMHYTEIAQQIVEQKLRKDVGATPASTVNANISMSLKNEPEESPFERVDRGIYKLRQFQGNITAPLASVEEHPKAEGDELEESTGIIQAFGMFWQRDLVDWTNSPELPGQQQGAEVVDFCDQRGVYLLHDGQRVVYVGQASDQPLGRRLNQHTTDRLNGRWDRFSWFGIRHVTSEGKLVDLDLKNLTQADIIVTLEALLIEGLEPPQNRKRGEDIGAVEYLQVEGPSLKKKRKTAMIAEFAAFAAQNK
jgi:hypothetical protein